METDASFDKSYQRYLAFAFFQAISQSNSLTFKTYQFFETKWYQSTQKIWQREIQSDTQL